MGGREDSFSHRVEPIDAPARRMSMTPTNPPGTAIALFLALFLASTLVGCSQSSESTSSDKAGGSAAAIPAAESLEAGGDTLQKSDVDAAEVAESPAVAIPQAIIATGTVNLRSADVQAMRRETQKVVDTYSGQISAEETDSNGKGELVYDRIVVRVPSERFGDAMADLKEIAKNSDISVGTEDVTTQVIDVEARVRAQTKSLERVEALLAEATTFKDVVAIESQLTRRQADLDSLKGQQAWLKDQTSMSTITVSLEQTSTEKPKADDSGFISGIKSGWQALGTATAGLATLLGALLPFAIVALILGYPLWRLVRRFAGAERLTRGWPKPIRPGSIRRPRNADSSL